MKFTNLTTKYFIRSKALLIRNTKLFPHILGAIFLAVLIIVGISYLKPKTVQAAWFDDSWLYRTALTINNTGSAVSDQKVKFDIDTSTLVTNSKLQSDCDDSRFTDINGNILKYFIDSDSGACNTSSTDYYVRLPNINANSTIIYHYYGNPSATAGKSTEFFSPETIGNKMKGFWKLNEASGTRYDFALGNTLTDNNTVTQATGKISNAGQFTAANSEYLSKTSNTDLAVGDIDYTLAAWVYADTLGSRVIVSKRTAANRAYEFDYLAGGDNKFYFGAYNGVSTVIGEVYATLPSPALTATWYFVVAWHDASANTVNIQVDNGTVYSTATTGAAGDGAGPFAIGSFGEAGAYWDGRIDAVGFWKKVLTSDQRAFLYNQGVGTELDTVQTFSPSSTSTASEETTPGPKSYWKLDDATGSTAQDATVNNKDGTITGATWQTEDMCIAGKCLKFDGVDDKVAMGTNVLNSTANFSVSAWVKTNTTGATQAIISEIGSENTQGQYLLRISTTEKVQLIRRTGTSTGVYFTTSNTTLSANTWYHIVGVYSGSNTLTIYINGIADTATAVAENYGTASTADTRIGMAEGTGYPFNGFIDDVKIYPYARSAAQVRSDFDSRGSVKGSSSVIASDPRSNLANGLVGYWKMDESSWTVDCSTTSVTDSSGNGNNGKSCPTTTGPAGGALGKFGNSGDFDGSNDYVDVADSTSLSITSDVTVSTWIKLDTLTTGGVALKVGTSGVCGSWPYGLWMSNAGTIYMYANGNSSCTDRVPLGSTAGILTTGSWIHVVGVYKASTYVRLYINGAQNAETTTNEVGGTIPSSLYDNALAFRFAEDGFSRLLDGKIDETRVYNRALSSAEVTQLYNFAPSPVGYWRMDENQGTSANDSSTNANTGSISGATWSQGRFGASLNYDGTDDVTTVTNASAIDLNTQGAHTLEAWVYADTDGEGDVGQIYQKGATTYLRVDSQSGSNLDVEASLDLATTDATLNISSGITTGTWNHIVVTYEDDSDDEISIYINGVLKGTSTDGSGAPAADTNNLLIGGTTTANFDGRIDDFRMYSYARSAKQIVEDMNAGHPAVGSPVGSAVGYWKFDEGTNNICSGGTNDTCNSGSAGSALDGAISGMASPATSTSGWTQAGKYGRALIFDGTNDYINMGDPSGGQLDFGTGSFSISLWINSSIFGTNTTGVLASKAVANVADDGWTIYYNRAAASNDQFIDFRIYNTSDQQTFVKSTITPSASVWHHIVAVRDSDALTMKIYIDGVNVSGSTTVAQAVNSSVSNSRSFYVGASFHSSLTFTAPFTGTIDEVKSYNYALTASEIKLDYNQGSAQVIGSLSDNSSYQKQAANQEYCVPGDSTSCAAPIARWDLEQGSGTSAYDTSGNGYTGTLTGGPTWVNGRIGKGVNFDGTNDEIDLSTPSTFPSGAGARTVSLWIKPAASQTKNVFGYGVSSSLQLFDILLVGGIVGIHWNGNGVTTEFPNTTYTVGAWQHVTFTYDGTSIRSYMNGVLKDTAAVTLNTAITGTTYIGAGVYAGYNYFNGAVDGVRVYNYARSAAQVAWDYNWGAPSAHWKFDECQGVTANDSSGNSNSGTLAPGAGGATSVGDCATSATTMWYNGLSGKYNYSLDFDGSDDVVTVTNAATIDMNTHTSGFAFSAWVYADSDGEGDVGQVFQKGTTTYLRVDSQSGSNLDVEASLDLATTDATLNISSAITTGTWNHIVVTWEDDSDDELTIYINGISRGSSTDGSGAAAADTNNLLIGGTTTANFDGKIDDFRMYGYAPTATQVKQIYNQGSAVRFGPSTGNP